MNAALREPASAEWSPEVAEAIARRASLALGPAHWNVLGCARELWVTAGRAPGLARIAACTGTSAAELARLFTADTEAVIWRVAGIPGG